MSGLDEGTAQEREIEKLLATRVGASVEQPLRRLLRRLAQVSGRNSVVARVVLDSVDLLLNFSLRFI